jgi:hypothetical protein
VVGSVDLLYAPEKGGILMKHQTITFSSPKELRISEDAMKAFSEYHDAERGIYRIPVVAVTVDETFLDLTVALGRAQVMVPDWDDIPAGETQERAGY